MQSHEQPTQRAIARLAEKLAIPTSQVDAVELSDFISNERDGLKDCESDVKDAKRRITAARPKQKRGQGQDPDAERSDSEGSQSV